MCTDLRLMTLPRRHVSARTYDWTADVGIRLRVVARGGRGTAVAPHAATTPTLRWANLFGFVGVVDSISPEWAVCDGLNDAGLSVAHLELPEAQLDAEPSPPDDLPAVDLLSLSSWLLGTCATVDDVRAALGGVRVWSPPVERLWPEDARPDALGDYAFAEHLAVHDAAGGDLVVEFDDGHPVLHDNPLGALSNSPPYDLQLDHLRHVLARGAGGAAGGSEGARGAAGDVPTSADDPVALAAVVARSGWRDVPDDVTSRSRFVRAAVLAQVAPEPAAADAPDGAVDQAFRLLEPLTIPPHATTTGDATRWCVVRDHDTPAYHVRHLGTGAHATLDLHTLDLARPQPARTLPVTPGPT